MNTYPQSTRTIFSFAIAFVVAILLAGDTSAQSLPLKASRWLIDPGKPQQSRPFDDNGAISFDLPISEQPDPNSKGPWLGYVVLPWTQAIRGEFLTVTLNVTVAGPKHGRRIKFNYKSEAANVCDAPASVRLYFQTSTLYNSTDGTRWWASAVSYQLSAGLVTLTVPLTPKNFSSTYGHSGDSMAPYFWHALEHPTYVGLTFGGGCFYGHGVNVSKGQARVTVLEYGSH
jgi:hypothetical protein